MKPITQFMPSGQYPIGPPSIVSLLDPLDHTKLAVEEVEPGTLIRSALEDYDLVTTPVVVYLNAVPLLESEWDKELGIGDVLTLSTQPGILPAIVIWALVGVALAGAAYSVYTILTLDLPSPGERGQSSNYSITYQGNRRRPDQVIPVQYGTFRSYPDYSGTHSMYRRDEQWLYQIFDITVGETEPFTADDIRYEDTPITAFEQYDWEQLQPGESSTIYPSNVITSSEVDSIELVDLAVWTPAYSVSGSGVDVTEIIIDVTAPQGTHQISDNGHYRFRKSPFQVEISGSGGNFLYDEQMGYSKLPNRKSISYTVPAASDYTVRLRRTTHGRTDKTNMVDAMFWEALRAVEPDAVTTNTTRLAVKIRASDRLGNKALSKLSVVCQRRIPVWSGSWSAPQATNSAAWAFADMCRNTEYGGAHADELIDLDTLLAVDAGGYEFNGIFDSDGTLWDALSECCRPMFARPTQKAGGIFSVALDEADAPAVAMYTMRNIVAGSFSVRHSLPVEETVNYTKVTFYDAAQDYRETSVDCVPFGITANRPNEMKVRGITDADVAYEYGLRVQNESLWRRKTISFITSLEGFIPGFMDAIRVGHYQLGLEEGVKSFSGEVRSNSGNTLTVFESLADVAGQGDMMCYLMDVDGSPWGPTSCSVSHNATTGISTIGLGSTPPGGILQYGDDRQGPKYIVGYGTDFAPTYKVLSAKQTGEHQVTIEAVIDNQNAYIGDAPPGSTPLDPAPDDAPTVWNLVAELYGTDDNYSVRLQWETKNSDYHIVEMSEDGGTLYSEMGRPREPRISFPVPNQDNLWIKVYGVGLFIGTPIFAIVNVLSGTITYPGVFNLRPAYPFNGNRCGVEWDALQAPSKARVKFKCNGQIIYQLNVNHAITTAEVTRQQVMAKQGRNIQGELFPAAGCRTITVEMVGIRRVDDTTWEEDPVVQSIVMTNDPMGALVDIIATENLGAVNLSWTWPETPAGGCYIHLGTVSGFIPTLGNLAEFSDSNNATIPITVDPDSDYYLQVGGFDSWGDDSITYTEVAFTSGPPPEFEMPTIDESHLSADLNSRIDLIDVTDGGHEGKIVQLQSDTGDNADGITANADSIILMDARVTDNEGDITAHAGLITQVQAQLDDPANNSSGIYAAVQTNATAIIDVEGDVTTIESKYTVKVDANGYVAGYGIIATDNGGVPTSQFHVSADDFFVSSPGATHMSFAIQDGVVRMDGAFITDASIYNAKIAGAIYSYNWDGVSPYGWHIDKDGAATFREISIIDFNGDVLLQAGSTDYTVGPAIDNAAQTWADISDIPDSVELAALNKAPNGAFGNVQFDEDSPSAGLVTIYGTKLYTSDGRTHLIDNNTRLDTLLRSTTYADAMFIFFTKDGVSTEFPGWSYGSNTTTQFFPCLFDADTDAFTAYDGAGAAHAFTPNKHNPIIATCSRPNSGTTGLRTFNSLIGTNLFLPQDGSTVNGHDNLFVDGDFVLLIEETNAGKSVNESAYWAGNDSYSVSDTAAGPTVYINGDGLIQQRTLMAVHPNELLYFSMYSYRQSSGGDMDLSVRFLDDAGNGVGTGEYQSPIYLSAGSTPTGWSFNTGVVQCPSNAAYMRAWARNRSSGSTWAAFSRLAVTRAPVELTPVSAPVYIRDLSVDTLQLADQAVTLPLYGYGGAVFMDSLEEATLANVQFTPSAAGIPIMIQWFITNQTWYEGFAKHIRLERNAARIAPASDPFGLGWYKCYEQTNDGSNFPQSRTYAGFSGCWIDLNHGGIESNYRIRAQAGLNNQFSVGETIMLVTEIKK